jgi:hypothetical protein
VEGVEHFGWGLIGGWEFKFCVYLYLKNFEVFKKKYKEDVYFIFRKYIQLNPYIIN